MNNKSEAAMKEGVLNSRCLLAIITGAAINPDRPGDPEANAFFQRQYCLQEVRWALEAGIPVQPVVRAEDKQMIGQLADAPQDLKCLGQIDFIHLDRADRDYWRLGVNKVLRCSRLPAQNGRLSAHQCFVWRASGEEHQKQQ